MIATLIFNLIAVFLAWLESNKSFKHGLVFSIITVFIFLALRFDFGNDYMAYLDIYNEINEVKIFDPDTFSFKGNEIGWLYLNRFFGSLGFFIMIAFLAAFTCFVVYRFIKKYVPPKYYWFAVFIFIFEPYSMLVLSSAMRQLVAVSIFLLAIDFIIQKKIIMYLLLILVASLFHTSALFLSPFILLAFINWRIRIIHIVVVIIIFLIPVIYVSEIVNYIDIITSLYFDIYSGHMQKSEIAMTLGIGFAINMFVYLIVVLIAQKETDYSNNIFIKITIISILMIPLSLGVQLISRINYYLLPVMMVVFPIVFIKIRQSLIRLTFTSIIILFTLYKFYIFFGSEVWKDDFGIYKTIFTAPKLY